MPDDQSAKKEKSFIERLFGSKDNETKQAQTEEEILSLVEEGQEKGLIEDDTKDIIENVFDFDDTVAYEIMTHRRDMTSLEDTDSLEDVVVAAIDSGHSRIPVYHEDLDRSNMWASPSHRTSSSAEICVPRCLYRAPRTAARCSRS